MPLPIERRVAALEQRTRCDQLIEVIIITFVSPGPNGPIDVPPIGYATLSDEPELRWMREDRETIEQTLERATRDARVGLRANCIPSLRAICADEVNPP